MGKREDGTGWGALRQKTEMRLQTRFSDARADKDFSRDLL